MRARDEARATERGRWRVSLALLTCVLAASAGLHTVFDGFLWWLPIAGVAIAILAVTAGARALTERRWVPPLVGAAAVIALLTAAFAPRGALLWIVPTGETWASFGQLTHLGNISIASQSVPAHVDTGILFLLCTGVGALTLAADFIANAVRMPALAGVVPLVLLAIPAVTGLERSDPLIFAVTAVTYLVLLRADRPGLHAGQAFAVGALAVIASLVVPLVVPPGELASAHRPAAVGPLAGVNPVLNLGADLRRQLERTILTYTTESGEGQYLRLTTLQNFTAETWEPAQVPVTSVTSRPDLQRPPGLSDDVTRSRETTSIIVDNLASPWLPIPYPATSVDGLSGEWGWDLEGLTLSTGSSSARGQHYSVESLIVQPTPQQLLAAGETVPAGFEQYLELPEELPQVIADTARYVAADASSNYQKAVALQEFFRDGDFVYSEEAPVEQGYDGNGMFIIAKFLEAQAGYCVHFSSAMAVMARVLGIPSRVAVGTLPGVWTRVVRDGQPIMRVTTFDLHAWPELYFDGVGWIRFEPTPGRGAVPEYADEQEPGVPAVPVPTSAAPNPSAAPTNSVNPRLPPQDDPLPGASTAPVSAASMWWLGSIVAAVVLLLLIPAFVRSAQRQRRLRRLAGGAPLARTGWREILQTAEDLGVTVPMTATPRLAAEMLAGPAGNWPALASVVSRLEVEAFAHPDARNHESSSVAAVRGVLEKLREGVSLRERMRARFAPRSIWQRLAALVRRPD